MQKNMPFFGHVLLFLPATQNSKKGSQGMMLRISCCRGLRPRAFDVWPQDKNLLRNFWLFQFCCMFFQLAPFRASSLREFTLTCSRPEKQRVEKRKNKQTKHIEKNPHEDLQDQKPRYPHSFCLPYADCLQHWLGCRCPKASCASWSQSPHSSLDLWDTK